MEALFLTMLKGQRWNENKESKAKIHAWHDCELLSYLTTYGVLMVQMRDLISCDIEVENVRISKKFSWQCLESWWLGAASKSTLLGLLFYGVICWSIWKTYCSLNWGNEIVEATMVTPYCKKKFAKKYRGSKCT
ncbi:unnamed protein product [Cuscuta europaea]|nr:unnamed protein product [Cuscuta europaea]